jgi:hypothetical protein
VVISVEIEAIDKFCFSFCGSLQSVSFCCGSNLNSISGYPFISCSLLESIVLPSSVETLGRRCFYECRKLVNSPLHPDSEVALFEDQGFDRCDSLTSMVFLHRLTLLVNFALRNTKHFRLRGGKVASREEWNFTIVGVFSIRCRLEIRRSLSVRAANSVAQCGCSRGRSL